MTSSEPFVNNTLCWTEIHQHKVSCFMKDGEEFILLPHLFQTSLAGFSSSEIEKSCDDVNIQLLRCNANEIDLLKVKQILPKKCDSIGLIRRSDAERLIKTLNVCIPGKSSTEEVDGRILHPILDSSFIPVRHDCFGQQSGKLFPSSYVEADSACITCNECSLSFSPAQFVGHCHDPKEIKTVVHWGFDSRNWRQYIFLNDEELSEKPHMYETLANKWLEQCKLKFFESEANNQYPNWSRQKMRNWKPAPTEPLKLPPQPRVIQQSYRNKIPARLSGFKEPIEVEIDLFDGAMPQDDPDYPPNVILKRKGGSKVPSEQDKDPQQFASLSDKPMVTSKLGLGDILLQNLDSCPLIQRSVSDVNSFTRAYSDAHLSLVKLLFSMDDSSPGCKKLSSKFLQLLDKVKKIHREEINSLEKRNLYLEKKIQELSSQIPISNENCPVLPSTPHTLKMKAKYDAMKEEYLKAKKELQNLKRRHQVDIPFEDAGDSDVDIDNDIPFKKSAYSSDTGNSSVHPVSSD